MAAIRTEAVRLGLSIDAVEVATPAALDTAFDDIGRRRPDALLLIPDNALVALADQIVSRALARRLPTFATNPEAALAGAVVTYGYLRREAVERTGLYLKKIIEGAKPSDLPIEQPTKFQLVVNLKTAQMLGIDVPSVVLAQADEVIE